MCKGVPKLELAGMDESYWAIEWYITQHFILQSMFKFYTIQPVAYEYNFFSMGNKYFYFHFEVDPSPLIR